MLGKIERQEEKGATEVKMVGWHHQLNGHEFEQAPGVGEGQGSLVAKSQTTERLNSTDGGFYLLIPFIYFTYFLTHLPSRSYPFILCI